MGAGTGGAGTLTEETRQEKIFLENMKVLPADQRLKLTEANTQNIMAKFKVKEQLMGAVVTGIPIKYDAEGAVSARMNLIHQCPTLGLVMVKRASFGHFGTFLAPKDPNPEKHWKNCDTGSSKC